MDADTNSETCRCIVCGKDTTGGRGFITLHVGEMRIEVCCSLCYQTYEKEPRKYHISREVRSIQRDSGTTPAW